MKKLQLGLFLALTGTSAVYAADAEYIARRLSYCNELAFQVSKEVPPNERARGMQTLFLTSRYMTKLEEFNFSKEATLSHMDRAKKDLEADNARIRTAVNPIAAAFELAGKSFAECNELAKSESPR